MLIMVNVVRSARFKSSDIGATDIGYKTVGFISVAIDARKKTVRFQTQSLQ